MVLVYDERLGVHPQAEGFTRHDPWDFTATKSDAYPLLLHFPYFDLYRRQVVKQADLVLALFFCGDEFADEDKIRDFEYYEPLTVRDSSLSASTQAVMAAETGHLDLAYDYWGEAALMDLDDLEHNTRDGLHIASLAGAWSVAVCGFGGMRDYAERLLFKPRLPPTRSRLAFHLYWRAGRLRVDIGTEGATYRRLDGEAISFGHYDSTVRLSPGEERFLAIPPAPVRPSPSQPPGRAPLGRRGPAA
jgi:alpha,alpha-trehalose phosphorylase